MRTSPNRLAADHGRRPCSAACAVLRAVLCGMATMAVLAQPADDGASACAGDLRVAIERVNAARQRGASCGGHGRFEAAGELHWNDRLREMAATQAHFLSDIEDLRHVGPNGQGVAERAQLVGYRYARVAENLALGARGIDQVLAAWTLSEGHCANLYDPRFTEMGLVCERGRDGRPLWVMVLGRPKGPLTP